MTDDPINIHDAKTHFSRLIERVQAGEEIVIAKAGKPVAKLIAIERPKRVPGALKHLVGSLDGLLQPWPKGLLRDWEEGHPGDPLRSSRPPVPRKKPGAKRRGR